MKKSNSLIAMAGTCDTSVLWKLGMVLLMTFLVGSPILALPNVQDNLLTDIHFKNVLDGTASDPNFSCGAGFVRVSSGGKLQSQSVENILVDTSNPRYLYYEGLKWDGIDPQKGLDTMRLFVERHANLYDHSIDALGYTVKYTSQMDKYDSAGQQWLNTRVWIDEYNWLESVYWADTFYAFQHNVIAYMATSAVYFDRNKACNVWYNLYLLSPGDSSMAWDNINQIRAHQQTIKEDTTPYFKFLPPDKPQHSSARAFNPHGFEFGLLTNPVASTLSIDLSLPMASRAEIDLFDLLGRKVKVLKEGLLESGLHRMSFDCSDVEPGSYYLRYGLNGFVKTIRISIQH